MVFAQSYLLKLSHRTLQHPALLQCLAQCTEVTPFLLVMEFCPMVRHILMTNFVCSVLHIYFFKFLCLVLFAELKKSQCVSCSHIFPLLGWSEELPPQLSSSWFWDTWPVDPPENGMWHCFRASAPSQKQLHPQVRVSVPLPLPSAIWALKGRIYLNGLCATCWSLLATTSWCCLSSCHKLQHQWFCCWGRAPLALTPPSMQWWWP